VLCQTDHRPLQYFLGQTNLSAKQIRWQQFLSEFNLEIAYIPGESNVFADGLSRRPDLRLMIKGALAPYDPWLSRIQRGYAHVQRGYAHDPVASKLLRTATGPKQLAHFMAKHGVLYRVEHGSYRVYVPHSPDLRATLMHEFHGVPFAGHFGHHKVYLAMAQHYYWPGMADDVKAYVQACPVCQRVKSTVQPRVDLHPLPVMSKPFEQITLDWLTGLPTTSQGFDGVLNIVDKFSKWAVVLPCQKSMSTKELVDLLWTRVFAWAGLPASIVGDRDTRLSASRFRAVCKALNLKLKLSVAYHPQTDGATEVFNKTLLNMLRCFVNQYHSNWVDMLPPLLYAYHNTVHSATGFTPHLLLFGWTPRDLRAPLSSVPSGLVPGVEEWLQCRKDQFNFAAVAMERARVAMVRAQHASANAHVYYPGDLIKISTRVLLLRAPSSQSRELQTRWIGPLMVVEEVAPGAYRVATPDSYKLNHDVFIVADICPWLSHESHVLHVDCPPVVPHPALNPVVQVLDRRLEGALLEIVTYWTFRPSILFCSSMVTLHGTRSISYERNMRLS
jgi:transposase InsO family protein